MTRRFHVFVNDAAGSAQGSEAPDLVRAFADHGVDATVAASKPDELPAAIAEAWSAGPDAIVIAGGDGTVNGAAQVAVEHGIVLGVLPAGTFNHFAKDLGVPVDMLQAVEFVAQREPTAIDVGDVNGTIFVNNASIGVYPRMVVERDKIRERRGWGKIRAVPVAVIRTLRRPPVHRLVLTLDGAAPRAVMTSFVFVGNGRFDEPGEGVGERTSLTEGCLGVYVMVATGRWRMIRNMISARLRGVDAAPDLERATAQSLILDADGADVPIALDGEPTELRVPLTFTVRRGALRVIG